MAQHKMAVEPPKKEDLQRSYATVVENDANPKGWYGSMSEYQGNHDIDTSAKTSSERSRNYHWNHGCHSLLHHLPQPLQGGQPG